MHKKEEKKMKKPREESNIDSTKKDEVQGKTGMRRKWWLNFSFLFSFNFSHILYGFRIGFDCKAAI